MEIVVLDGGTLNPGDNPWTDIAALGELTVYERTEADQVVARAQGAAVVLTNKIALSADILAALSGLRCICVTATGYNIVDVAVARKLGIAVCNVPVYGTDSVAQFVFALLLELCHGVGAHCDLVHGGEWARRGEFSFWNTPQVELAGKTMGLVGFGRIGRRVGQLANAFGMRVLAYDSFQGDPPAYKPFAFTSLNDLFAVADVVSLHCPLTPQNRGLVDRRLLSLMKTDAFLINTARGPLVNEADLAEALLGGRPAGAALDVVSEEPIQASNPLLTAPRCILTPHIAWATLAARKRLMATTAQNIAAFLAGRTQNVVN